VRAASAVSLAFTAALLVGCGSETPSEDRAEDRDLTLQAQPNLPVEVASAVELARPVAEPKPAPRPRISPKPAPAPTRDPAPEAEPAGQAAVPVPAVAVAEVLAEPAPVEDVVVGAGRELAPGRTVTVIPASSGPSSAPIEPDWPAAGPTRGIMVRGGGDRCRPRGGVRGIGIAGGIPVGLPGRRLR
jgi:hypothetical protein